MNRASPMPMGARKVALCFSAASMKMQKISSAVNSISINKPRTMEVPGPNLVRTARFPGNRAETMPAAAMPARICDRINKAAFNQVIAPINARATETCEVSISDVLAYVTCNEAYCWIEKTAADAEEDPDIYGQRETESQ
jgi:hypothetical protein